MNDQWKQWIFFTKKGSLLICDKNFQVVGIFFKFGNFQGLKGTFYKLNREGLKGILPISQTQKLGLFL